MILCLIIKTVRFLAIYGNFVTAYLYSNILTLLLMLCFALRLIIIK